jgi:trigger factor
MNVKVEKTDKKDEVKLTFKVEAEKFNEAIKKVYTENSKYFQVPGFRKGKAPFAIVEKYYGIDMFYQDAFNDLVPPIYEKALEENNIDAISKPEIDIKNMKKDEDLEFVCTVQTKPEIKLSKYKGVEIPKIEHKTT